MPGRFPKNNESNKFFFFRKVTTSQKPASVKVWWGWEVSLLHISLPSPDCAPPWRSPAPCRNRCSSTENFLLVRMRLKAKIPVMGKGNVALRFGKRRKWSELQSTEGLGGGTAAGTWLHVAGAQGLQDALPVASRLLPHSSSSASFPRHVWGALSAAEHPAQDLPWGWCEPGQHRLAAAHESPAIPAPQHGLTHVKFRPTSTAVAPGTRGWASKEQTFSLVSCIKHQKGEVWELYLEVASRLLHWTGLALAPV